MNVLIRFTGGVLLFVFLASCDDPPTDQSQSCISHLDCLKTERCLENRCAEDIVNEGGSK